MKRYILLTLIPFLVIAGLATSCSRASDPTISHYTCPMHPEIISDKPGACPICHMDLVPVKKETSTAPASAPSLFLSSANGIQTGTVAIRSIVSSIVTQGRLAYNPDWWEAETELIEALRLGDARLTSAAESRLSLMGASSTWIANLKKRGRPHADFIGQSNKTRPLFEATIQSGESSTLKEGNTVSILSQNGTPIMNGHITSIGSITHPETRTIALLIEGETMLPETMPTNQFVQVAIHREMGNKLSIPNEALLFNGDHVMTYVEKETNQFTPVTVSLGHQGSDYSEIVSGLSEGDRVVTNGHFMLDSESRLKQSAGSAHQH